MSFVGVMRTDFTSILPEFQEDVDVYRATISYDTQARATESWSKVCTLTGDWQPREGKTGRTQAGMDIVHDARFLTAHNANVQEGDRLVRIDTTFEYVVFVKPYASHKTVFLSRKKGSE